MCEGRARSKAFQVVMHTAVMTDLVGGCGGPRTEGCHPRSYTQHCSVRSIKLKYTLRIGLCMQHNSFSHGAPHVAHGLRQHVLIVVHPLPLCNTPASAGSCARPAPHPFPFTPAAGPRHAVHLHR